MVLMPRSPSVAETDCLCELSEVPTIADRTPHRQDIATMVSIG